MFDSLDEQIKHDEHEQESNRDRILKWLVIALISIVVFAGLYLGVRLVG